MTDYTLSKIEFPRCRGRRVEADFGGGDISSNGGVALVAAADRRLGLRTVKTKGCLSRRMAPAEAFKLILSSRRKWRKLDGSSQLAELIEGVPFKDGIKQIKYSA